ncbi:MAG: carbon-nitrogen hydrolase family protein [Candidatus Hermodarchaeota archaeon]
MKVTVCELHDTLEELEEEWKALVKHVKNKKSDLLLLPEIPFYPWMAGIEKFDVKIWKEAILTHERWVSRFNSLDEMLICGTHPTLNNGHHFNEGFIWKKDIGLTDVHKKYYLPNEEGFLETTWFEKGEKNFSTTVLNNINFGFLICTEIWFTEHARAYAKQGIQILLCPRASLFSSVDKWIVGGRVAAIMSGAYCLSSNHCGYSSQGFKFGGTGWIIEPENGDVLGTTSSKNPFLTLEIDLKLADNAKAIYPRDILE